MSKITQSARGERCQIRFPGICNHDPETTVFAHYRLAGYCGTGIKPPDFMGAYRIFRRPVRCGGYFNTTRIHWLTQRRWFFAMAASDGLSLCCGARACLNTSGSGVFFTAG